MKYNPKTESFIIDKNTFIEYRQLEEIRFKKDLLNTTLYSTEYIFDKVHNYKFQDILTKYQSVGFRTLLFSFHTMQRMSILQAAVLKKNDFLKNLEKFLQKVEYVTINKNGGFSEFSRDFKNLEEYIYLTDFLIDNQTNNLIIENNGEVEAFFLKLVPEKTSQILHYKDIAHENFIHDFLTSRNDWILWIYTQGMDSHLYEKFLDNYQHFIKKINIKTSNEKVISLFKEKYQNIEFISMK